METKIIPIPYGLRIVIKKFQDVYPNFPEVVIGQLFFDLYSYCGYIERNEGSKKESFEYLFKMAETFLVELNLDSDDFFCHYFMERDGIETMDSFFDSDLFQEATEASSLLISLLTEYAVRNIYQGEELWGECLEDDIIDYVVLEEFNLIQNIAELSVYMGSESRSYI